MTTSIIAITLNSFSFMPVKKNESEAKWYLVADYAVARYLRSGPAKERGERMAHTLADVVKKNGIYPIEARCCGPYDPLDKIIEALKTEPVLVVDEKDPNRLIGILTGFDII